MLLITGAAGKTGRAVLRALAIRGAKVRAFVRSREQARAVESFATFDIAIGDLTDRRALVESAAGCQAIYHICPNLHPKELEISRHVVAAAAATGCERLVYHSVLHPQTEAMPHHWQKLRVEESLFESGLQTTILQPCAYMQNVLTAWHEIETQGCYRVPYSADTRFSWVDLEDVAETAAMVLTEPGHEGATYELSGPQRLSSHDVANILTQHIGHDVQALEQPLEAWRESARRAGLPSHSRATLSKMFQYYDRHGLVGNPRVLAALLAREPTTLSVFAERELEHRRSIAPAP